MIGNSGELCYGLVYKRDRADEIKLNNNTPLGCALIPLGVWSIVHLKVPIADIIFVNLTN